MPVNELKRAYYAGLFDGDGCVRVSNGGNSQTRLDASISQCWTPILEELKEEYGGTIVCVNRTKSNPNHRDWWYWQVCSLLALKFLKDILPYSVIKKEQIELAIQWQETRNAKYTSKGVPEKVLQLRDSLASKISALKHVTDKEVQVGN